MTKVEELRERKIAVWVQLTRDIFLTYGCHDRHIDQLLDDFEKACSDLYRAEGADQILAMSVGIVTCWNGVLGMTEAHDLKYPLVQGATYALLRVCETDGAMDGHATMEPSVRAPKEAGNGNS